MVETHHVNCTLCEATCGITVTTDGPKVLEIRGDEQDPVSKGYICPKATALADLHHDPDRLKRPLVKRGGEFVEVGWDEAFDLVGRRLRAVREKHGKQALGVYYGNPTAHNPELILFGVPFFRSLGRGHGRRGVRLGVAARHPGVSINDVTDERFVDELTGTAAFSGQRVTVRAMARV